MGCFVSAGDYISRPCASNNVHYKFENPFHAKGTGMPHEKLLTSESSHMSSLPAPSAGSGLRRSKEIFKTFLHPCPHPADSDVLHRVKSLPVITDCSDGAASDRDQAEAGRRIISVSKSQLSSFPPRVKAQALPTASAFFLGTKSSQLSFAKTPTARVSVCCADDTRTNGAGVMDETLSDITISDLSTTLFNGHHSSICSSTPDISGAHPTPFSKGEDLEHQRQMAAPSIDADLFVYDDIAISKNEARAKHWRVAGRKPALASLDISSSSIFTGGGSFASINSSGEQTKKSGNSYFFFNDFDICVDEMDLAPLTGEFAMSRHTAGLSFPSSTRPLVQTDGVGMGIGRLDSSAAALVSESSVADSADGKGNPRPHHFSRTVTNLVSACPNTAAHAVRKKLGCVPSAGRPLRGFSYDTFLGHATRVKCIALLSTEKDFASCSNEDASVALYNIGMREEVGIFTGHEDTVINAAFSPDGKYLATTSKDRRMILWDVMTTKQLLTFDYAKVVICCCFAPDSRYLVSGCQDRVCRLWDTRRGKEWLSYTHHEGIIIAVDFSPDGSYVCSASADRMLRVWSTTTAKTRLTLTGHTGIILSCSYTSDGKFIVSNDENLLLVWSVVNGSCTLSLRPTDIAGVSTALNPPQMPKLGWTLSCAAPGAFTNYLVVACNNRYVYVLDVNSGSEVASIYCKAPVYCLTAGPKELMACGDSFGNIYLLRLR